MVLRVLSGFLVIIAAYLIWWSITYDHLPWLIGAAVFLVAAIGLWARQRWAQYLWYVISATSCIVWVVTVVRVVTSGWLYDDPISSVISLVPGLLVVTVCIFGSLAVRRNYRGSADAL